MPAEVHTNLERWGQSAGHRVQGSQCVTELFKSTETTMPKAKKSKPKRKQQPVRKKERLIVSIDPQEAVKMLPKKKPSRY